LENQTAFERTCFYGQETSGKAGKITSYLIL
jgi:hypothetical protein